MLVSSVVLGVEVSAADSAADDAPRMVAHDDDCGTICAAFLAGGENADDAARRAHATMTVAVMVVDRVASCLLYANACCEISSEHSLFSSNFKPAIGISLMTSHGRFKQLAFHHGNLASRASQSHSSQMPIATSSIEQTTKEHMFALC